MLAGRPDSALYVSAYKVRSISTWEVIDAHRRGLGCQRFASRFLASLVLTFSPLAASFVAIFAINALPFIVQLAGSLGEIANHLALAVEVKRVIPFTIDVKFEIWTVIGTEVKVP